jgi:hypothetical protein
METLYLTVFFKIKIKQGHIYHFASVFDTSVKRDWGALIATNERAGSILISDMGEKIVFNTFFRWNV